MEFLLPKMNVLLPKMNVLLPKMEFHLPQMKLLLRKMELHLPHDERPTSEDGISSSPRGTSYFRRWNFIFPKKNVHLLALLNRFPRDHGAWVEGGSRLILEGSMAMRTAREPPDEDASDGEPDRGEGVGEVAFRPRE